MFGNVDTDRICAARTKVGSFCSYKIRMVFEAEVRLLRFCCGIDNGGGEGHAF